MEIQRGLQRDLLALGTQRAMLDMRHSTPPGTSRFNTPHSNDTFTPISNAVTFSGKKKKPFTKPDKPDTYYVNHTHWDREWYRLHAAYQARLAKVMDDIVTRMNNGKLKSFCMDGQVSAIEDYLEIQHHATKVGSKLERKLAAEKIASVKNLIKSGRLEIGPWFVQPDLFLTSGESLVRNLKKGMDKAKELGSEKYFGYLPDPFGQPSDMPLIFNGFGIDDIILWRGANPEKAEFYWKSRDGSESLVRWYPFHGYSLRTLHIERSDEEFKKNKLEQFLDIVFKRTHTGNVLIPLGGDHLGATPDEGLDILKKHFPEAKETTFTQFMDKLKTDIKNDSDQAKYKKVSGHLLDNTAANILQGVYSSRMYLKQSNRKLEHQLTKEAEPLMAFSKLMLKEKPETPWREWDKAWTQLLYNQPHDSICGCSIDEVHLENEARFNTAQELTNEIVRTQKAAISAEQAGSNQWIIYNNSGKPYTGPVKVSEWAYLDNDADYSDDVKVDYSNLPKSNLTQVTKESLEMEDQYLLDIYDNPRNHIKMLKREGLIWVENVPPLGTKVINQTEKPDFDPVRVFAPATLNNGLISVAVAPDGSLTVEDLKSGKTYQNLHTLTDQPEQGDSYNSAPVPGTKPQQATVVSSGLTEFGKLKSTLTINYKLKSGMPVATKVHLYAGSNQLEFETEYTNTVKDHKLQVAFDTGSPINSVTTEGHFGLDTREFNPNYNELKAMPANRKKQRELATNSGAIQRFVTANGQLVATEGLTEYEVSSNQLKITLLRTFNQLSDIKTGVRDDEAGPPLPTPGGQMLNRKMNVRYAWQPEPESTQEAYAAAEKIYGVVSGEQGRGQEKQETSEQSMAQWNNPNIVSSAVKLADNGKGLLVRLINTTDQPQAAILKAGFDIKKIKVVDFAEKTQAKLKSNNINLAPYQVQTFILEAKTTK